MVCIVLRYTLQLRLAAMKGKDPRHPGTFIKTKVIPAGLSVKAAAELLGVGRPALSNLLNGNAALSAEMALRLEKAFGVTQKQLLELQAEYDRLQDRTDGSEVAVRTYVPSYLKIKASQIESWAKRNVEARSLLAVLLRKLVNSTGQKLTHVDFPGYDNSERKGWDGQVISGSATPWIPLGKSGWEFGCNEDPKRKAEGDYAARVGDLLSVQERSETTFVFVTPRNWPGKDKWAKEKEELHEWKGVLAFDASDLEQWLEQSIVGQGWLAEQMGLPTEGAHTLEEQWRQWATVTAPELSRNLFHSSVEAHKDTLTSWLKQEPNAPLIVSADSRIEALAFLSCLFEADALLRNGYRDRAIVFSCAKTMKALLTPSSTFLPIVYAEDTERELGTYYRTRHAIIVRNRDTVEPAPGISLGLLSHAELTKALGAMGVDHHRAQVLARECGYSPTILRRRLSKIPAIKTPPWAQDASATGFLIPLMFVGAWHARSKADCDILCFLAGVSYDEIEQRIARLQQFEDPPVWAAGTVRGVSSKIDAFFAVHRHITQKDIDNFLLAAELVLSEIDPALDLPEDKRAFAGIYGKTRLHSRTLREGICETLVLLAVHGNTLFRTRLGIDLEARVNELVRRLLSSLSSAKLLSQASDLPLYAEAAPDTFLSMIEEDLKEKDPQINALLKPADTGLLGGGCPRSGLLWALENLAWKPEQFARVCLILAKLAQRKIKDNWANKPDGTLLSLFRAWLPQTAAPLDIRIRTLEVLAKKYPDSAWQICLDQLEVGTQVGHYNHRPRWRSDASGAGQGVSQKERIEFTKKSLELALDWPKHNESTLGELVARTHGIPELYQKKVWQLVIKWAKTEVDEKAKANLRERIRKYAFTRRSKRRGLSPSTTDKARSAYAALVPKDVVLRHEWLFANYWVEESLEELEDEASDYKKRDERIARQRVDALREIWSEREFEGIRALAQLSEAPNAIGWYLFDVLTENKSLAFLVNCLSSVEPAISVKLEHMAAGFLQRTESDTRRELCGQLLAVLPPNGISRLLKSLPFQKETWLLVDAQEEDIRSSYWRDVTPPWLRGDPNELNEAIDRLLAAKRPRAAFHSAHLAFAEVETSRLKRLLHEIATCDAEGPGSYKIDPHEVSSALENLQGRAGITEDEMARFEFMFIQALEHSKHGIPNMERQIVSSPMLFAQVLAMAFKRSDDGEDPPEWRIDNPKQREYLARTAYALLKKIRRLPGTDQKGLINAGDLKDWIEEARSLCAKHARESIGDNKIGQILSSAPIGEDGVWPCMAVREVVEELAIQEIANGIAIGIYNSRGVHWRGEGGGQERDLAAKYRNWSSQLAVEYPFVSNLLEQIAAHYDREAAMEDSDAAVRRRLMF